MLKGKKIILLVTGSIAAYKAAELVRLMCQKGSDVRVIMTEAALAFIGKMTLQALSHNPVRDNSSLLDPSAEASFGHIELARWADCFLVAPASASCIADFAAGSARDLGGAVYLATEAPVFFVPAMNHCMWRHPATQKNIHTLQSMGMHFIGPASGLQACGETGMGRMEQPEAIVEALEAHFSLEKPLSGKRILITAGPTQEAIDPVRFIGNHSSGKMGVALAKEAQKLGAHVELICGPIHEDIPQGIVCTRIKSAAEMLKAVMERIQGIDCFIGAAAVADYRLESPSAQKIKKEDNNSALTLNLVQNEDILKTIAQLPKKERPLCVVGFAAETENVLERARAKKIAKAADYLVANPVGQNLGFYQDNIQAWILGPEDTLIEVPFCSKTDLAKVLFETIAPAIHGIPKAGSLPTRRKNSRPL